MYIQNEKIQLPEHYSGSTFRPVPAKSPIPTEIEVLPDRPERVASRRTTPPENTLARIPPGGISVHEQTAPPVHISKAPLTQSAALEKSTPAAEETFATPCVVQEERTPAAHADPPAGNPEKAPPATRTWKDWFSGLLAFPGKTDKDKKEKKSSDEWLLFAAVFLLLLSDGGFGEKSDRGTLLMLGLLLFL